MDSGKTMGKAELSQPQPSQIQGQQFEPLLRVQDAATLLGGMHPNRRNAD